MPVYDNTSLHEMKELLAQMKELHAPDRCEGLGNDAWQLMQPRYYWGDTPQQKITNYWNSHSSEHVSLLKKMTTGELQHDFWKLCYEVNEARILDITNPHEETWQITSTETAAEIEIKQQDLDNFIDASDPQKIFETMIVQWAWRNHLLKVWGLLEPLQQQIEKKWNSSNDHKSLMKMITPKLKQAALKSLWDICKKVDSSRASTLAFEVYQTYVDKFIGFCTERQLQAMFNRMIVEGVWRDRFIEAWEIK